MQFLYNTAIRFYTGLVWAAALFNPKAKKWMDGRRAWRFRYRESFEPSGKVLWVHTASLGEFEQGRPVIEAFRLQNPGWQLVLSFFSPSGFEIRKNYGHADFVCYLPADTPQNARDFIDLIRPDAAIFVKYEFWRNYLTTLSARKTPTLLISALFRPDQPFFQPWGGLWRDLPDCFSHVFVQDVSSLKLLKSIGYEHVTVAGDTRVDRVLNIAASAPDNPVLQAFTGKKDPGQNPFALIVGSSWEADEAAILPVLEKMPGIKMVVAPHEPTERHVNRLLGNAGAVAYSAATPETAAAAQILVIDNVGMLNQLYKYGSVAFIGGGFGKGIHNTLEPAAFGLPVIFGPKYEKFEEARAFTARGGAFPVQNSADLTAVLKKLSDPDFYQRASAAVKMYLEEQKGATEKIIVWLNNHLLH
jgi:3-deoxy-D-manno-octulosonic-acid transferase